MRYLRHALLGLLALAAMALTFAAACGTDGQERDRTGIPELDAIIDAVLTKDIDTLEGLVIYEQAPCSTSDSADIPEPPPCAAGEPDGTPVDFLSSGACKPGYVRREEVPGFLRERIGETELAVYAVFRTEAVEGLNSDYTIIFTAPLGPADRDSVALSIAEDRIAFLATPCASFEELARSLERDGAEAILPPPESGD